MLSIHKNVLIIPNGAIYLDPKAEGQKLTGKILVMKNRKDDMQLFQENTT